MSDQEFQRGDRVCARSPMQSKWRIGIITDVFIAPVTGRLVYVIDGTGYYADEVTVDIDRICADADADADADAEPAPLHVVPEPQSLRA